MVVPATAYVAPDADYETFFGFLFF